MRVLAPYEIGDLFEKLADVAPDAQKLVDQTGNLQDVLNGTKKWTDQYLKLEDSLQRIFLQASSLGISFDNVKFKKMLLSVLEKKRLFSREDNAWSQYEHLADWLIEVGSLVDLRRAGVAGEFLTLVDYSFRYMKKEIVVGYSWAAFGVWQARFGELKIDNQQLIREYAKQNFISNDDVAEIVASA